MNQVCVAPAWRSALQRGLGGGGRLRGLDIDIKEGNPKAIGVYARAAQGTAVESVRIFAVDAAVGLQGGAGSGGSHIDIQVHGGVVGLDLSESQPAPTITRAMLVNQTGAAINYAYPGRQTLTLTGVVIERNAPGPAIEAGAQAISMVDSVIECGGGPALSVSNGTNVLLKEVWTRGCGVVVAALPGGGNQPPVLACPYQLTPTGLAQSACIIRPPLSDCSNQFGPIDLPRWIWLSWPPLSVAPADLANRLPPNLMQICCQRGANQLGQAGWGNQRGVADWDKLAGARLGQVDLGELVGSN